MAQLMINYKTPITFGNQEMTGKDYFNLLKKQTILNYEKIVSTKTNDDLDFYLPQTFNHMLAAVTSMNQFLLSINLFLQKNLSEINKDLQYKKNILNTIFAHNLSAQNEFDNKLGTQFNYLFKLINFDGVDPNDLVELRKIGIIFTIVENFFRNHEAHGLTGSLIDFFRGYNTGIYPSFILKCEYLENFELFNDLPDRFCFTFPEEDFLRFKTKIESFINEIKDFENLNNTTILNKKMQDNILNTLTFSEDKIGKTNKKELNPYEESIYVPEFKENILFVRSDIVRSYFKYNSIIWNNDVIAHDINEIENALQLQVYKFISESEIAYDYNISISPASLLKFFKMFVEILEKILFEE